MVVNKVVFFDILHQLKECRAIMENDVKACFEHVLPALVVVTCCRLGLPDVAAQFLFKTH